MHDYRRLVQSELDARGWTVSELARRAGMHRQAINKIVRDQRDHIGQMPDDVTIERLAGALGIPPQRLAQAAARSLVAAADDSDDPLDSYSTEYLLEVIRRRVTSNLPNAARHEDHPKPVRDDL